MITISKKETESHINELDNVKINNHLKTKLFSTWK